MKRKSIPSWGPVRETIERALTDRPHVRCFVEALGSVVRRRFGRAALIVMDGMTRGAVWEFRNLPDGEPASAGESRHERKRCGDSEYLGPAMMVLERLKLQGAGITGPSSTGVQWEGEELGPADGPEKVEAAVLRWLAATERWSRCPSAIAAFVVAVSDGRVNWVGTYLTAAPGPAITVRRPTSEPGNDK